MASDDATPDDEPITLDDNAVTTTRKLLRERDYDPAIAGLRIAVKHGGCAGLTYHLELADSPYPDDVVHDGDVRVFVDPASHPYLAGTDIRFEETAHGTGFRIDNPNADQECGCGLSFRSSTSR